MRPQQFVTFSFLILGLTACGGGGSSGDAASGSSGGGTPFPPQTPLVYGGVTTAATVSSTNAGTLASNVMGASSTTGGSGSVVGVNVQSDATASGNTGVVGLMSRVAVDMRPSDLARAQSAAAMAGAAIDRTVACESGNMHITGTVSDTNGTGSVNVAYNMCRTGGDTINGPAALRIDAYDAANAVVTDGTLTVTRINITGPGLNSDFTGTLRTQVNEGSQTQQLTGNIITQDNTTQRQTQTQNLVVVNQYDNVLAPTFYTQSISGRVFDSQQGYVDVSTTTAPFTSPWGPLYFATTSQSFPDWGIINLNGTNSTVKITSLGADLAKVEVDANNDGTFENSARMRWAEFGTPIGADLADSDGDGMHNSWETFYGLNPNNAADAAADSDGDGFTNIQEYRAGTSPITNGSVPNPVRHIWVTNVRDLGVDANGQIEVFVGGTGSGVLLDPVTTELGAPFSGATEPNGQSTRTITDAQGRTFTLAPGATPTTWTITSSTGGVLSITNVAGTDAGSLIRWGAHGLAFRTVGASSPGYIYIVESAALVP
jgi:hypothetical protein